MGVRFHVCSLYPLTTHVYNTVLYMCVCTYIILCMFICVYVCMYVRAYLYMYVYICVYDPHDSECERVDMSWIGAFVLYNILDYESVCGVFLDILHASDTYLRVKK